MNKLKKDVMNLLQHFYHRNKTMLKIRSYLVHPMYDKHWATNLKIAAWNMPKNKQHLEFEGFPRFAHLCGPYSSFMDVL
jgi:hypothetical protein